MRRWSEAELSSLSEHYLEHGPSWSGWAELLPGRTRNAIAEKAMRGGLAERRKAEWSEEELRLLEYVLLELSKRTGKAPSAIATKAVYRAKVSPMLNGGR